MAVGLRWSLPRRVLLSVLVVLVVVVGANVAAYDHNAEADFSAVNSFSLSRPTTALLGQVRSPLKVIAFLNGSGPQARQAGFLLARYREVNRLITWSVVDPDTNPGEARRYGVTTYSAVVLVYRGRTVDAPAVDEGDLSTAILRLLRGRIETVCVLTGHGEPQLSDTGPNGLSDVSDLLGHNAYRPMVINLSLGRSRVPPACPVVLEMGPQESLLAAEVQALDAYLRGGGRLMWISSSLSSADPNPVIGAWGIHFQGGLVLDPARSEGVDFSNVIVQSFPSANPVDAGVSSLQFPATASLVVGSSRGGLTVSVLGQTSDRSYIDPHPESGSVGFGPGDIPGPAIVAAAADSSRLLGGGETRVPGIGGPRILRTRLFVTSCDTWMTNGFLNHLGNRRFFVNAVDWLAQQEQLVLSTAQPPAVRALPLTPALQAEILGVTVGAVPGGMVLLGAGRGLWLRRRKTRNGARRRRRNSPGPRGRR